MLLHQVIKNYKDNKITLCRGFGIALFLFLTPSLSSAGSRFIPIMMDDIPIIIDTRVNTVRVVYIVPADRPYRAAYEEGITFGIKNLQVWYQNELGGSTFRINDPVVEVLHSNKTSSWFTNNLSFPPDPSFNIYYNSLAEAFRVLGAKQHDRNYRWIIYTDAVGRGGGAAAVTVMPDADLKGLIGENTENYNINRWIGGVGHELGHTYDLPHPAGCDPATSSCPTTALMWLGHIDYPNTYFTPSDKATLLAHPLISKQRPLAPVVLPPAGRYTHSTGQFVRSIVSGRGVWTETSTQSPSVYTFEELRLDSTYIYLLDRGRNSQVRLPIAGGQSHLSTNDGTTWNDLYKVARVWAN